MEYHWFKYGQYTLSQSRLITQSQSDVCYDAQHKYVLNPNGFQGTCVLCVILGQGSRGSQIEPPMC